MGCFVFLVAALMVGTVWWFIEEVGFGHVALFFLILAAAMVVYKAVRKVRYARRRAAVNEADIVRAKLSGAEVHIRATRATRGASRLNGRLQGVKDAKEAKAMVEHIGAEAAITFSIDAGADFRWVSGYREGIAEILPEATVEQAYEPQKGSFVS